MLGLLDSDVPDLPMPSKPKPKYSGQRMAVTISSQAAQEVQYVLLLGHTQQIELSDHGVGFRPTAGMILDRG
jgi:hypothetical protein